MAAAPSGWNELPRPPEPAAPLLARPTEARTRSEAPSDDSNGVNGRDEIALRDSRRGRSSRGAPPGSGPTISTSHGEGRGCGMTQPAQSHAFAVGSPLISSVAGSMASVRKREWTSPKGEAKGAWVVDSFDHTGNRRLETFTRKEADAYVAPAALRSARRSTPIGTTSSSASTRTSGAPSCRSSRARRSGSPRTGYGTASQRRQGAGTWRSPAMVSLSSAAWVSR